jgi:hypothetical protein
MARKPKAGAGEPARPAPEARAKARKAEAKKAERAFEPSSYWTDTDKERIEGVLKAFRKTRNPLMAWLAFALILEVQRDRDPNSDTVKLPPELFSYFGRLTVVMAMMHFRCSDGDVTPDVALAKTLAAFGFVRKGWNAFDDARRLAQSIELLDIFDDIRASRLLKSPH